MFDSRVLETAIGLIFVFLGFSLITTALQEAIASMLKLRAATLRSGLKTMIADGDKGLFIYEQLIAHPLVTSASGTPSYISADQFCTALLHVLGQAQGIPAAVTSLRIAVQNLPDAPYKTALLSLFREGETDLGAFEARVRQWFDEGMDRVSGVYKRTAQQITLVIGTALAFLFQANAIGIACALWTEAPLRAAVATTATGVAQQGATLPTTDVVVQGLAQFNFVPIWVSPPGWSWAWIWS